MRVLPVPAPPRGAGGAQAPTRARPLRAARRPPLLAAEADTRGFLKVFRDLPEERGVVRVFERRECWSVHGDAALLVARRFYRTTSVLRCARPAAAARAAAAAAAAALPGGGRGSVGRWRAPSTAVPRPPAPRAAPREGEARPARGLRRARGRGGAPQIRRLQPVPRRAVGALSRRDAQCAVQS